MTNVQAVIDAAAANLLSPMVLCFALGAAAGFVRSDLEIPEAIAKALSLYLMFAIGFKGGAALSASGAGWSIVPDLAAAVALSFLMPVVAFAALRIAARLDAVNAAAVSAHYGSISIVTYVAATAFLEAGGIPYEGHVTAMVALMETPAIVTGLLLARLGDASGRQPPPGRALAHEVLTNGAVVLLLGAFAIGWATGSPGMAMVAPLVDAPFKGVLCLFLLDMGLLVARRFAGSAALGPRLIAFGLIMPLAGAALGLATALALGMSRGGAALLATLAASASYIAVPAAMRLALPKANPSIYVSLSLGVTFPFNVSLGIPLYWAAADRLMTLLGR